MNDVIENFPAPCSDDCVELCTMYWKICLEMVQHCLTLGGKYAEPELLRLLTNCDDICELNIKFLISKSPHADHISQACTEVCKALAGKCESMDEKMAACGAVCRQCAEICEAVKPRE